MAVAHHRAQSSFDVRNLDFLTQLAAEDCEVLRVKSELFREINSNPLTVLVQAETWPLSVPSSMRGVGSHFVTLPTPHTPVSPSASKALVGLRYGGRDRTESLNPKQFSTKQ